MPGSDDPASLRPSGEANHETAAYAEEERRLSEDPSPLFQLALNRLLSLRAMPDHPRRSPEIVYPVHLEISGDHRAHLLTSRRGWRRSKGYLIRISHGFFYLLNDVAELTVAYSELVSKTGEMITPVNFTEDEARAILQESVSAYVMGENRWSPSEKLTQNNRERLLREMRLASARRREYIHSGRRLLLVLFTLAHELGHVAQGHCDPSWFSGRSDRRAQELEADEVAAGFLLELTSIPPKWWLPVDTDEVESAGGTGDVFTDMLMLGSYLKQKRSEQRIEYHTSYGDQGEYPAPLHDIILANALTVVAALFMVLELTETASREMGESFKRQYPPSRERYEAFRRVCVEHFGFSEEWFTGTPGALIPPDRTYELFSKLAEGIEWREAK